jgi:serpin B
MYRALDQRSGNVLFSPFSIRTALAMAQVGARGETAAQMSEVLRTSSLDESADVVLAAMIQRPNAASGRKCEISVANSLWCQDGAPLQAAFLDLIERHYHGGVNLVDFRRAAESARVAINRWVEDNTRQKIRELIPSGTLDAYTRLVLVNAVYFKGTWARQFSKAATRDEPFHLEGDGTVRAPLMHQKQPAWYMRGPGYQAVDLTYEGSNLSMLVLVPDLKDGLRDLEQQLSTGILHAPVSQMSLCKVELFLPRFKIVWGTMDMSGPLRALGMTLPFDPSRADFSGINGCQPPHEAALHVSAVLHKTRIEVNEEGTEAAAATAVDMKLLGSAGPPPPRHVPVVRADHPFLFAIRERWRGAVLFLGRVADPTRES